MLRSRKAKIVATLGPATESPAQIAKLFRAGVDVFRLNFSHGSHENKADLIRAIRQIEREMHHPIGILTDLQGPKFRVGQFAEERVELEIGQRFILDTSPALGDVSRVCLPHPTIFENIEIGHELLLNDGALKLEVVATMPEQIETRVIYGDYLSSNKGVNLPSTPLPISALTEKDEKDLAFILQQDIDWIALSFVQKAEDIELLAEMVGTHAKLMAKIEKPNAVDDLSRIIEVADGIMIARGDLGVEMPSEQIPVITKGIIRDCREQGKPVLVATQMLESMIHSPKPTRAEASDVATAIYDGADAVMLSAETAIGQYPEAAVGMMHEIIRATEADPIYRANIDLLSPMRRPTIESAICASLGFISNELDVTAAVTYTSSGATSLRAARERPHVLIISVTESDQVARQLTLVWGIYSVSIALKPNQITDVIGSAREVLRKLELGQSGDKVIVTAGMPFGISGTTNFLHIVELD